MVDADFRVRRTDTDKARFLSLSEATKNADNALDVRYESAGRTGIHPCRRSLAMTGSSSPLRPGMPVVWSSWAVGRIVRVTAQRVTIRMFERSLRIWQLRSVKRSNLDTPTAHQIAQLEITESQFPAPERYRHQRTPRRPEESNHGG